MKSFSPTNLPFLVGTLLCGLLLHAGRAAQPDADGIEFFEKKIRPVLVDRCYKCHSAESEKVKGGLLVDTREALLKGGDTGPSIVPGDPEKSLLIKAVRYTDEDLQMPPKNKKLSAEQIADLEAWVKMGAPEPVAANPSTQKPQASTQPHWAFQPIKRPALPVVKNERWIQTPVDNFVLAKLEAKNMSPAPRADKRTLIRRVTFDLTGLPPTPQEVEVFIADQSPEAYSKVVERLLASPRYGERWARHWLDVARYADTKGYLAGDEERRFPYSYTYRDYVVRAFNEDLPYDQFLIQQIAADQLDLGEDKRPLAALGFLTLGRRFLNNQADIIDDRIDVVMRGTMALTVACARCHDHKYDPIPTKDYYSLYGVFASSSEPGEKPLLGKNAQPPAYNEYLAERKKRQEELDDYRSKTVTKTREQLRERAGDYLLTAGETASMSDKSKAEGIARQRKLDPGVVQHWVSALETRSKKPDSIFAPWFAFAALTTNDFSTRAKELATEFSANQDPNKAINPLVAKAFAGDAPASLKEVAERYGKLLVEADKSWQSVCEAQRTNAVAAGQTNFPAPPAALSDPDREALRQVLYADDSPARISDGEVERLFDVPSIQKVRALRRKLDEVEATHPGAPPRAMALVDNPTPTDPHVFVRGNAGNQGPKVPRQFVEVVAGKNRKPFQKGSGRLELAQAIANRNNPLTARVIVNRLWLEHFGAGLVHTSSDFGMRSEQPVHLELLDYLANRFMDEGWSLKNVHRWILLSSTYQESSAEDPRNASLDPNNELFWRMNRRRLDFEATRDTLLAVAGKIDLSTGGHSVELTTEPFSARRTVYGYIDRQNLPNLFRTFDFASPDTSSPQRFFTVVPQQALFLMNSPFVIQQAKELVARADFQAAHTDEQRLRLLYQIAFQRDPTAKEIKLARRFTESQKAVTPSNEPSGWQYGYGEFDEAGKRTKHFEPLPHFTGSAFQGGDQLPDPKLGWVSLNAGGGHPGGDPQHAAIRRWIAPRDGHIAIAGSLRHEAEPGDGVRGRIVASRSGELGEWLVHHGKEKTDLKSVTVKRGDTIDFVTDCRADENSDSFVWSPIIRYVEKPNPVASVEPAEWNAETDFGRSESPSAKHLDTWQKYAQVLLLANELVYVD